MPNLEDQDGGQNGASRLANGNALEPPKRLRSSQSVPMTSLAPQSAPAASGIIQRVLAAVIIAAPVTIALVAFGPWRCENVATAVILVSATTSSGLLAFLLRLERQRRLQDGRPGARQPAASPADAESLQRSNADLLRLARNLTSARDKAERANAAKSRFLATMSHELRTPLSGILGYAQLLRQDGGLTEGQSNRVDAMLNAGQHLLDMISRILVWSEIEADHVGLDLHELDASAAASECLELVRPIAEARSLALRLVLPDLPVFVNADPVRLRQILLNLLGNALKFTVSGSVALRVLATDERVRFAVSDTGPGVPIEKQSRLFHDFERLGADPAAVEGSGLGLALSARLAALMHGTMGYHDNAAGGGSVFWLDLPAPVAAAEIFVAAAEISVAAAKPAVSPNATSVGTAHRADLATRVPDVARLRALVVDDTPMSREIVAAFLRAMGHEVLLAAGGAEAIETVAHNAIDVIFMDVRMPGMDGLQATRKIRALPGPNAHVPIIALTAQAFDEQVQNCRAAGMNDHVAKPFTAEMLQAALTRTRLIDRAPTPPTMRADRLPASDRARSDLAAQTVACLVQHA